MKILLLGCGVLVGLCVCVFGEEWSETNIQYLYGRNFTHLPGSDVFPKGDMETITIEHAGEWEYGNNFFFVDMASADFESDKRYEIYGEWIPKLSLSKLGGVDLSRGVLKDLFIAGEINQGDDFRVYNLGVGLALDLSGFDLFDINLYHRKDNYNEATFQVAAAWCSRFELFSLPMIFEGFLDYYGTDFGTELISQPRLLLDGRLFGERMKKLQAGVELYYYRSSAAPWRSSINEEVPQIMIKWIW